MGWAQMIAAALGVGTKFIEEAFASGDRAKQKDIIDEVARAYGGMLPPELKAIEAEVIQKSAFEDIAPDQENKARQLAAYEALEREYTTPGGSDAARAVDMRAQAAAGNLAGSLDATNLTRMRRRGIGGGGLEAMMSQQAGQAGVNRAAMMQANAAEEAQQRRMRAIEQAGEMASGMRRQGYGESSDRARAIDALNRANAGMRWDAKTRNANMAQQDWDNRMALLQAQQNAKLGQGAFYAGSAGRHDTRGDKMAALIAGAGAGAAKAVKGYSSGNDYDEDEEANYNDDD